MTDFLYAAQIHDGLFDPSPKESVFRVKNAVSRELQSLDSTANIHQTEYFNHTFAPDIVLTWPDQAERHVFLRLSHDLDSLAEDLDFIDRQNPMIIGLTPPKNDDPGLHSLKEAISSNDMMFTDPDALETLIARKKASPTSNLINNALAQGGKGVLIRESATTLSQTLENGFTGAEEVELTPTLSAVTALRNNLSAPQAWRINRVLQAIWEGSAGPLDLFPGDRDLSGELNVAALKYLVSYMETDDLSFWRRIGRTITVPQIERLSGTANSLNINRLINANLDVIKARAYAVIEDPLGVDSPPDTETFSWTVKDGHLTLAGPDFSALIAETRSDLPVSEVRGDNRGVDVRKFIERTNETQLNEVTIRSGRDVLRARNEDGALDSDRLLGLASQLGPAAEVTEAVVNSSSGRVSANLRNLTGTGQTRSNILMTDLLMSSLPVLHKFDHQNLEILRSFLPAVELDVQEEQLFDIEDIVMADENMAREASQSTSD